MDGKDGTSRSGFRSALRSARAGCANQPNGRFSSKNDESSDRDSIGPLTPILSLRSPSSSTGLTGSSPSFHSTGPSSAPSSPSPTSQEASSRTALSPSSFVVAARPPSTSATSFLEDPSSDEPSSHVPSLDQIKTKTKTKTKRKMPSKSSERKKRNDEASLKSDGILGPFAHGLQRSTREKLLREANVLRDQSGQVCPLQMAQLFWANSLRGAQHCPELDQGARSIQKMRMETFNLECIKKRRDKEDADRREKEAGGHATKRKYGLKQKTPKNDPDQDWKRKRKRKRQF